MAATKHDAIVAAIVAKLLESPALAGGNVDDQTNADELPEGASSAVRVSMLDSQGTRSAYGSLEWSTTIRVAAYVRTDKADTDGRASSRLGASVFSRLMSDPTLGGLANGIDAPRISNDDATRLGTRAGVQYIDFPVRHETPRDSIT